MAITSLNMEEDVYRKLSDYADKRKLAKGRVINEAVRTYLEREERRDRMHQETLDALDDIETGRVVDGDKVLNWLRSWGTENESPPPRS